MKADRLFAEFDRLTDAPDGVPRLRRFVLDLAVRGHLAGAHSDDGSAAELLRAIDAVNSKRTIRSAHAAVAASSVSRGEIPFELPDHWLWTRLGRIVEYLQRGKSPKYSSSDGPLVVSQKCVRWEGLDLAPARAITQESLLTYEPERFLRHDDLLWNSTGTGTIGRVARLSHPPEGLVCDGHVTVVRCVGVSPEYIRCWLRSDHVYGQIETRASGATNQIELTLNMALAQIVPLPPLAEQHRIVTKIGELMKICDDLERSLTAVQTGRGRAFEAILVEAMFS